MSNAMTMHVVLAPGVVSEVRRPPLGVAVVTAAPQQQPLDEVVTHAAGGGGDHVLPAEYHPADRGRVLGDEEVHVLIAAALRQVEGDQVGGHLVADEDRRDDDGGHPADPGQPQRAVALPRRPQDLAEARVDQRVGHHDGGLFRRRPGCRGGHDVHDRADHGDGRGRSGRRAAGRRWPGPRPAAPVRTAGGTPSPAHAAPCSPGRDHGWARLARPARGGEVVRHKRSIRPESGMVLVAQHKPQPPR